MLDCRSDGVRDPTFVLQKLEHQIKKTQCCRAILKCRRHICIDNIQFEQDVKYGRGCNDRQQYVDFHHKPLFIFGFHLIEGYF
jgi:hypothetical protein